MFQFGVARLQHLLTFGTVRFGVWSISNSNDNLANGNSKLQGRRKLITHFPYYPGVSIDKYGVIHSFFVQFKTVYQPSKGNNRGSMGATPFLHTSKFVGSNDFFVEIIVNPFQGNQQNWWHNRFDAFHGKADFVDFRQFAISPRFLLVNPKFPIQTDFELQSETHFKSFAGLAKRCRPNGFKAQKWSGIRANRLEMKKKRRTFVALQTSLLRYLIVTEQWRLKRRIVCWNVNSSPLHCHIKSFGLAGK